MFDSVKPVLLKNMKQKDVNEFVLVALINPTGFSSLTESPVICAQD